MEQIQGIAQRSTADTQGIAAATEEQNASIEEVVAAAETLTK